jgi:hypothetical protein
MGYEILLSCEELEADKTSGYDNLWEIEFH